MKLLGAASLGGLVGLAGCAGEDGGDGGDGDDDVQTGGRLSVGWNVGEFEQIDPHFSVLTFSTQLIGNFFSGLFEIQPDFSPQGDLATDWDVQDGGEAITFDLVEDATFHNGDDFLAEDVEFSIRRVIEEETPHANKFQTLEVVDDGGVVVESDYHVTLNFSEPFAPILVYLTPDLGNAGAIASERALEEVGLEREVATRYPHQFSGGQQQRIAIARSLTVDPDLLIADEPVSSLDVSVQAQILGLLERLRRERDIAMVFIAHDLSVVKRVADRVAVMYLGEIVESAPAERLFADPAHPYTKSLLSAAPDRDQRRRLHGASHAARDATLARGSPERLSLSHALSGADPARGLAGYAGAVPRRLPAPDSARSRRGRRRGDRGPPPLRGRDGHVRGVARRIRTDHLDADPSTIPEEARRTLLAATDVYVEAGAAAAADELSGVFETPCERAVPAETTVERDHVAACHRVDSDRPGAPDHLDV